MQPVITVNFKNYPTIDFRVKTLVQENNVTIDSMTQIVRSDGVCGIYLYKKEKGGDIEEVKARKFILVHNNTSDTVSQANCTYIEYMKSCDFGCGNCFNSEYVNFTFLYKNQVRTVTTLTIDY